MAARDIVTNLIANDKASKALKEAGKAAKGTARDYDDLSAAEQRLALEAERASVAVDKAARAAGRAEERFGVDSELAREATRRLRAAKLDLADAEEKVKRKADEAGEKTTTLRSRLQSLVPTLARNATGLSAVQAGTRGLGSALGTAVPALARVVPGLALFGSVAASSALGAITLGTKLAGLAVNLAHVAAMVGPAAASLPALAGGFLFAKATITTASIGIAKGLDPIMKRMQTLSGHLQNVAGRGVPALSRSFLKVNFPTIADAMNRIAVATNRVVRSVGEWINGINGQRAIRAITEGTATAVERLAPHVAALAESFGNLVARAGPSIFGRVATGLGLAANAAGRFLNSISKEDILTAWAQIDRYAAAVRSFASRIPQWGSAIMGMVRWWKAHADAIQHVRDVLAVVAIVVGVATGGWLPALGAGVSLLISHWDDVTAVLGRVQRWFHGTSDAASSTRSFVDGLRSGVSDLVSWFRGQLLPALERGARAVMPAINDAVSMVTRTFHDNRDMIEKGRAVLTALGIVVTEAIIPVLTFLAQTVIRGLGLEFSGVILVVNRVLIPGIRIMAHILLGVLGDILHGADDAFGWIPGLGGKLHEAATKFDKFKNQVNSALNGIADQTVSVKVTLTPSGAKLPSWYGTSAGMGGHAAGGYIRGPGGPRDDQVPALLSNGEYVVNAAATARHRGLLESINANRYAHGGLVLSESLSGVSRAQQAEMALVQKMAARMPMYPPPGPGGRVGSGVRQWAGLVAQVLAELGQPASALGPVLSRMQRESGGNPRAINLTDSNARAGDPSRGLMQTIGSTFAAFAGRYRGAGIWDPHANIYAGINYAIHRYGAGWISRMLAPGGYDRGGLARGAGLIHKGPQPERVLSPAQTVRFERAMSAAPGPAHMHVTVEVTASAAAIEDRIVEATRSAVRHGRLSTAVIPPGTRA